MTTTATKKLNQFAAALIAVASAPRSLCRPLPRHPAVRPPKPVRAKTRKASAVHVPSRILGRSVPYCVILPPGYAQNAARRYPVLYYLPRAWR